jgi:hypothetical protein
MERESPGSRTTILILPLIFALLISGGCRKNASTTSVLLADQGRTAFIISVPAGPSETEAFAASELSGYLHRISGASFPVKPDADMTRPAIKLTVSRRMKADCYSIAVRGGDLVLTGGSGRGLLYAVYDFLGRLGCHWWAPDFSFYNGHAAFIPRKSRLLYVDPGEKIEQPAFTYRKIDAMGRNSEVNTLKEIIDWMPKLRYNTLLVPFGKSGSRWDKWRQALLPEIKKRGLILEVGGHGYQNFLNADMEGGRLLKDHPDWFGLDSGCRPSHSPRTVFNTSNPAAVAYFTRQVISYLSSHPEVDIFDLWPPDGARWSECSADPPLHTPEARQAFLANHIDSAIKKDFPSVRLEIIAYDSTLELPKTVQLNKDILVDICPINQNFERQIYDAKAPANAMYAEAIERWDKGFSGDIGLYSYYRKSAWRSLPNVIPHYMQRDMQWYSKIRLKGISCYAYHDDWFTYEINHYILGHLAWNPDVKIDSLIGQFCRDRYGRFRQTARSSYAMLEDVVRREGSITHTTLKPVAQIEKAQADLKNQLSLLQRVSDSAGSFVVSSNLSRLLLMFECASRDLDIQQARAAGASGRIIEQKIDSLLKFLTVNGDKGVFQLKGKSDKLLLMKHYGQTTQSLLGP